MAWSLGIRVRSGIEVGSVLAGRSEEAETNGPAVQEVDILEYNNINQAPPILQSEEVILEGIWGGKAGLCPYCAHSPSFQFLLPFGAIDGHYYCHFQSESQLY